MRSGNRDDLEFEHKLAELLADSSFDGHPLRAALGTLWDRYNSELDQLERLTSIADGYHSALRARNDSLSDRFRRQIRQLNKIVRISDHYQEMLRDANERLLVASTQDYLTGLPNRRLMLDRLQAEAALVDRSGARFSVLLIDIDHFKSINDQFGHDVGDATLVALSRTVIETLRGYDVCARWGGEEFLVLLPETWGPAAMDIANRLCRKVESMVIPNLPAHVSVSVSIGVAEQVPGAALAETVRRADQAMYEAKRAGRNRVVQSE